MRAQTPVAATANLDTVPARSAGFLLDALRAYCKQAAGAVKEGSGTATAALPQFWVKSIARFRDEGLVAEMRTLDVPPETRLHQRDFPGVDALRRQRRQPIIHRGRPPEGWKQRYTAIETHWAWGANRGQGRGLRSRESEKE